MTPQTYIVDDCSQRQDGEWLVTFLRPPGFAVSPVPIERGTRITVVNGRVV